MQNVFLICYDICDPKRLRKVHQLMKGVGDSMQYSVFRCELSPVQKHELIVRLWDIVDHTRDRILFANLGPQDGRGVDCLEWWGNPRERPEDTRQIVL